MPIYTPSARLVRMVMDGNLTAGSLALRRGARSQYYVATTGNDTTGDGSAGAPWATIDHAIANVPDEGAEINVDAGTYAESTSTLNYLYLTRQFTELCTVKPWHTGDSVTLTDNGSGTYCVRLNGVDNLEFKNITIQQAGANSESTVVFQDSAIDNMRFTGCTIYARQAKGAVYTWTLTNTVTTIFSGCTLESDPAAVGNMRMIYGRAGNGGTLNMTLSNCTVTGDAIEAVDVKQAHANGDCTLNIWGGTYTNTSAYAVWVQGGTVNFSNASISAGSAPACVIGADAVATYATAGTITNCDFESTSSHALIQGGASAVTVTGGTVTGGDHGIVFKECDGAEVRSATVVGGTLSAVYWKGATNATLDGCTVSGAAGDLLLVGDNPDNANNPCSNLTCTDNTVTASGSADIFAWAPAGAADDGGGSVCDRNAYDISSTTGNVGNVYGTSGITTLAGLQAAWDSYDVTTNDDNSTLAT